MINRIGWDKYIKDCYTLKEKVSGSFTHILIVPRGGLIVGRIVMEKFPSAYPLFIKPTLDLIDLVSPLSLLIIDDLIDTGKTLLPFVEVPLIKIAVLYVKEHSPFLPDFYVKRTTNEWIKFPYEDNEG